jgi:hypothetical protein
MTWLIGVAAGIGIGVVGGTIAATFGGVRVWGGVVATAAGSLVALRAIVGPELDTAPAQYLVLYSVIALASAVAIPLAARLLLRGDFTPFRQTRPAPATTNANGVSGPRQRPGYVSPNAQAPVPTVEQRRSAHQNRYAGYRRAGG